MLSQLLEKEPLRRLSDSHSIKKHPFFANINWEELGTENVVAPQLETSAKWRALYDEETQESKVTENTSLTTYVD